MLGRGDDAALHNAVNYYGLDKDDILQIRPGWTTEPSPDGIDRPPFDIATRESEPAGPERLECAQARITDRK